MTETLVSVVLFTPKKIILEKHNSPHGGLRSFVEPGLKMRLRLWGGDAFNHFKKDIII